MAIEENAEVGRIVRAVEREGHIDLEAVEGALVTAVLRGGGNVLEKLLQAVGTGRRNAPLHCPRCGAKMNSKGLRKKRIQTLLGCVEFERSLFVCSLCAQTRYPGDEALGIVGTSYSPGVRRQVARLAAKETFFEVSVDMRELARVEISRKDAERVAETVGEKMETWMAKEHQSLRFHEPPPPEIPKTIETLYIELDGTGIPMVPREVEGRKGKQPDDTAKTREAKVGCVFTQTLLGTEGKPIRDPASTTFLSAIETSTTFGWRLYSEAVRRGLFDAKRIVVLGDGAEWVKNIAQTHFGTGQFIIDYYHAYEHIGELCRALFERNPRQYDTYHDHWADYLWEGNIEMIIKEAGDLLPTNPRVKKDARTQIGYFQKNKEHMRYAQYRAQHLFIGSGVVEASCKHLVGARLKQSGMEWTVRGANSILALRSVVLSNRQEAYWEQQAA